MPSGARPDDDVDAAAFVFQGDDDDALGGLWLLAHGDDAAGPGVGTVFELRELVGALPATLVQALAQQRQQMAAQAQAGGGIAGDFPICVVASIKYDLQEEAKPWAYSCQISDSTTSYGSNSGATPNEKITWDTLTKDTPLHVIESDATIVAPLILQALLEAQQFPDEASLLIAQSA